MRKKFFILLSVFITVQVMAQDIHFSQFYAIPIFLNPAKTGFFDASYRAAAIYRNQWNSVTIPYKTISASFEGSKMFGSEKRSIAGLGFTMFSDKAGDADYSTTEVSATGALNLAVGAKKSNFFGIGGVVGYARSHYDFTKLYFDEDFLLGDNTEDKGFTQLSYLDLSLGAEYNYLRSTTNYYIGLAGFHLNQPMLSYYGNTGAVVYRKFIFNGGVTKKISPTFEIYPRVALVFQGPYNEIYIGAFSRLNLDRNYENKYALYFGGTYRFMDAIIPNVRFEWESLSLSMSYDINVSKLTRASTLRGGPEIALLYTGKVHSFNPRKMFCPRF